MINLSPSKSQYPPHASPLPIFISQELITEVLSFLPVKSLMRFKSVTKSWKYLISDHTFVKLHLNRSTQNSDHTIVSTIPTECMGVSFTVCHLFKNPPIIFNLPNDPYYQMKDKECNFILGSCNGLLCLSGYSECGYQQERWLRFWNPATRTISEKLGSRRDNIHSRLLTKLAFGYDNSTDTYKVVRFFSTATNVRIFSLGHNVWRNIQNSPAMQPYQTNVVHLSGFVTWLGIHNYYSFDYKVKDCTIDQFVIISLDLATETHTQFLPPQGFDEVPFVIPNLSVLKDFLCFSHDFRQTHFVIWQMKEFGVEESWTRLFKISYDNFQIEYTFGTWLPLYLSKNSDTLLLNYKLKNWTILCNLRANSVERINSPWFWGYACHDYVESLVSYS